MPAKKKYLSGSWNRFSKIMAIIFGAYLATLSLHLAIAKSVTNEVPVLLTSVYSTFLMWVGFMIMIYLIRRVWLSWSILLGITGICAIIIFL